MFGLVSSIEILIVNLIINELATTKKLKKFYHYLIITIHTAIVFLIAVFIIPKDVPVYLSILIAWTYLIPFFFIYKERIMVIIITMSFALTHSIFVNGLAYHISTIRLGSNQNWGFIILQTAIFVFSTPLMVLLVNKRIKLIINFLNTKNVKIFLLISLASFFTVFIMRFFIDFPNYLILVLVYITIFFLLVSSYFLAYTIIHTKKSVDKLNILVYEDSLTKIKNRIALYDDFQKIADEGMKCALYFLDLDKLKNINDTHGHLIGDKYIVAFTEAVKKCIRTDMDFYRISGDEFIIMDYIKDNNNSLSIEKIQNSIEKCFNFDIEFQGVSIGKSMFPKETDNLDSLLSLADKRMYVEKSKIISK